MPLRPLATADLHRFVRALILGGNLMDRKPSLILKPRPTITDVARAAHVAKSTVSYVLNDTPGQTISAATRARVRQMAEQIGYVRSSPARALSRGHSDEICHLVTSPLQSSLTASTILSGQNRARALGYTFSTYLYDMHSPRAWQATLQDIFARRPAGIIAGGLALSNRNLQMAHAMGIAACVLIRSKPSNMAPTFVFPLNRALEVAGRHLADRGHRRIGIALARLGLPRATRAVYLQAWHAALAPAGAASVEIPMDGTLEGARETVARLLQSHERPTAICTLRDEYGFMLVRSLVERQVRIPEEMALVSAADSSLCGLVHPALTAVRLDTETLIVRAVDVVDHLLRGVTPPPELFILPPPQLVIREST